MIAGAWAAALAQTADGPSSGLNLPSDLTIFGNSDPTVHKATAIVNGAIITDTDVDQRLALVVAANGGKVEEDERNRLKLQVLRNLIDETLQIQEAKAQDITISKEEIDQTFQRVSNNFKRTPAEFAKYLSEQGSSAASLKRQIEGELAWRRVLGRKVEPFVSVGEEEVQAVMKRLNAAKGTQEFHIGEIFLSSTPATAAQVAANAARIVEQVRGGASFVAYARQFSEASTAAVGGDLGWVRAAQLPEPLAQAVETMGTGQLSDPIAVPGGLSIIALIDKRQVLTSDPRDAVLALKQLSINFPKGMTQAQATPRVAEFAEITKNIQGCGKVDEAAKAVDAEVVDNDQIKVRDLPPQLQQMMLDLQVGQATPPFGSLEEGVRVLVLCGRDDPQSAQGPSFDQIYAQMEEERVNRRAQRYLRDLRRDAVVDYR
ncbi:MAG TPA: peptidylprolyl isomerase [Sphingomonadaceae bacterium]|nr:peptidylprolyl isomerase [Sphingomonadaceae bacterium]